jgi:hypothetical protein
MILKGKIKKAGLILIFIILYLTTFSLTPSQVKPLPPDQTKGQVKPLPIEEPEVKKVCAKGVANIYEGNVENSRKAALRAAYAEAVSQGSMIEIGSMSLIKNVKYVSDIVLTRSRGFIRNLKILNEGISDQDKTRYEVFIEAEVISQGKSSEEEIDGLRLYLNVLGNPILLIILPESNITPSSVGLVESKKDKIDLEYQDKETRVKITKETSNKTGVTSGATDIQVQKDRGTSVRSAETALAQAFSRFGYNVVTSDDLQANHLCTPEDLDKAKAGVTTKIIDVARAAEVDLVLYGVMNVSQEITKPAGVEMAKVVAEASAKAVVVSSGSLIDAFHQTTQAANFSSLKAYSDCIEKAANNIADVLAWKIPQILADTYREMRLVISPINLKNAEEVKNALKSVSGIEDVRFAKIPTVSNQKAELILLSGFIIPEKEEIVSRIEEILNAPIIIERADKFNIVCTIKTQ